MADATQTQQANTDDTKTAPTEEQVKQANAIEEAKWQDDFKQEELNVPYKREESDDKTPATDTKTDKPVGETNTETATEGDDEANESQDEVYTEPAPVVTVEDPGEFVAPEVAFKVEIKDGDKTKKVTVKSIEEAEQIAENAEHFDTPKQLLDFITKTSEMRDKLTRAKEKWQEQKDKFDEQKQVETNRLEYVEQIDREINYLIEQGELPAIPADLKNANWDDPAVAKREEIKQHVELINRLAKERENRQKAGLSPIVSALDVWKDIKLDNQSKQKKEQAEGKARQAAGAKVAGVSASQQSPYVPKGIAVGNPNVFKRNQAQWDD